MHRTKRDVVSSHDRVTVRGTTYRVDEQFLLLDLTSVDDRGQPTGEMSAIRLYAPGLMERAGLKLVKYWVSYKCETAAFFFLQRNVWKQSSKDDPNQR